jgi:hypothetical protein
MEIKKAELKNLCDFIEFISSCNDASFIIDNRKIFTAIYPHQMAAQLEKWRG